MVREVEKVQGCRVERVALAVVYRLYGASGACEVDRVYRI